MATPERRWERHYQAASRLREATLQQSGAVPSNPSRSTGRVILCKSDCFRERVLNYVGGSAARKALGQRAPRSGGTIAGRSVCSTFRRPRRVSMSRNTSPSSALIVAERTSRKFRHGCYQASSEVVSAAFVWHFYLGFHQWTVQSKSEKLSLASGFACPLFPSRRRCAVYAPSQSTPARRMSSVTTTSERTSVENIGI